MCICFRTGCRHTEWVCLQCSHMCRCPCVCNYRTVCPRMGRGREEAEGLSLGKSSQPHSSVGKESACNSGDPSSIPGSGRSTGEGISYSLQYSWASLVAQMVKNLPAMWESQVQSLSLENPLEKGKVTHFSILA